MRAFYLGTFAAVALSLGVSSNASADWRYREHSRFEHGRYVVVRERYWVPDVVPPPAPASVVVETVPVYTSGYSYNYYRPHYRYPAYRHVHRVRRR